jgi:NADPH-dependent curcumin reductase CurA
MSKPVNQVFRLAARPVGMAKRSDFSYEETPLPEPADGELLMKIHYISLDPAMRGWMNAGRSYIRPVEIGEVMRAGTVGQVLVSRHPKFAVGDFVSGNQGVQSYAISDGKGLIKVDPKLAPLPKYLNVLGMPGMTAYFGLLDVGLPKPGEMVLVSAAAPINVSTQ